MLRQIVLDTETTGLRVEDGHRIIEVGCVELIDRKLTGKHFHYYFNPERDIEAGAVAVHGITTAFLRDKPVFSTLADDFVKFITGAELIIHNAPFDLSFIDAELQLAQLACKVLDYCQVIDTLQLARSLHAGQRNSLDALCKRYHIDNSKREMHGALLDANLLAQVYLAMTGGQGSFFESFNEAKTLSNRNHVTDNNLGRKFNLIVQNADAEELELHQLYLENMKKLNKCIWLENNEDEVLS
ncbi:MAG: DNA polymerase III subunit epsilon [Gammaproteobacteria bacterium]|nr:DNA polymerase III subunit epsilon [Gammaproteobacteria bacterium]